MKLKLIICILTLSNPRPWMETSNDSGEWCLRPHILVDITYL